MEHDAQVQGEGERQEKEGPIGRIKERGLETAEERRAAEKMRVPKDQMSVAQFPEAELAPPDELAAQVLAVDG
jgi:hypothetical protein